MTTNNKHPDVIFIGQPNCGKSTLFNAAAGLRAETSNFPGTTVTHTHSKVNVNGKILNIIDLPGTYSLNPADDAEKVALSHLFQEKPDIMINVVDASTLGRSLEMTFELMELRFPMVVALNMVDLAEKKGIAIDAQQLSKRLGVPVIPTIASHGRGVKELLEAAVKILEMKQVPPVLTWSRDVEEAVSGLMERIPENFPVVANRRFTAVKMIELEKSFFHKMLGVISPELTRSLAHAKQDLERMHNVPAYEVIAAERHHLAMKIFEENARVKRGRISGALEKLDDLLMHPLLGYIILLAVFLGFFWIIFKVGNPLESWLLQPLEQLRMILSQKFGDGVFFYLADGLLQGVGGGVAIVLPYFVPLLFLMALLEDVGYLARAGFLMDIFMHRMGLHGKSVSPFILGFGCNVPAIISTRILESRRDRIITALLIPFIPCSARTTIILALVAFYMGPFWAVGFYFFNMLLVGVLGRIISMFFRTPSPGLILEIPSLKIPSLRNIVNKVVIQLKAFLKFAWPILIAGSVALGLLQFFHLDHIVNILLSPLVVKALGLPQELGVTLVFGFLRKELSMIMMLQALGVNYQALMTAITREQLIVFTVFVSFFIPCLSTVAIMWKEIGRRIALISVALNVSVAIILSIIIRLII